MSTATIPLGYAVGSGDPVTIPLGHMAVVGVTQKSGKTTTLDALSTRVHCPVLAFVTKRGEGAFQTQQLQQVHPPYFRERADWQFVEAVLEATMRERMKYERGWIMKVCRGMTTLRDVHVNVKAEAHRTKSQFARDMYEKLDAYFDIVVPQLAGVRWAPKLSLTTGLNVMDLTTFSAEMQALILGACLDYVQANLRDTIVIVPEAWEFLPRARKSPVTLAAEMLVRKGAALGNYLWIDSQDLAGVHTPILKSMHVWLLGVQREINEIKRTLAHVHGVSRKPKPDDIAGLRLGQFYACFESTAVKTYVQPAWMPDGIAEDHAKGHIPYTPKQMTFTGFKTAAQHQEEKMDAELKRQNEHYAETISNMQKTLGLLKTENEQLRAQLAQVEAKIPKTELASWGVETQRLGEAVTKTSDVPFGPPSASSLPLGTWPAIRAQILSDDAILAKIATLRPEILIEVTPKTMAFDGDSAKGRLARMVARGLFDEAIKPGVAIKEFARTGGAIHPSRLSEYLGDFVSAGFLTREGDTYVKAPGLKVTTKELQVV